MLQVLEAWLACMRKQSRLAAARFRLQDNVNHAPPVSSPCVEAEHDQLDGLPNGVGCTCPITDDSVVALTDLVTMPLRVRHSIRRRDGTDGHDLERIG